MPNSDSNMNIEGWRDIKRFRGEASPRNSLINWARVERYVFKLQTHIYAASRLGDIRKVRKLQRTLMRSWSNKVLAVRRVTQDNQGSAT